MLRVPIPAPACNSPIVIVSTLERSQTGASKAATSVSTSGKLSQPGSTAGVARWKSISPPSGTAPYMGEVHYSYPVPAGQTEPLNVQVLVDAGGLHHDP